MEYGPHRQKKERKKIDNPREGSQGTDVRCRIYTRRKRGKAVRLYDTAHRLVADHDPHATNSAQRTLASLHKDRICGDRGQAPNSKQSAELQDQSRCGPLKPAAVHLSPNSRQKVRSSRHESTKCAQTLATLLVHACTRKHTCVWTTTHVHVVTCKPRIHVLLDFNRVNDNLT